MSTASEALAAEDKIKPWISRRYPLEDVPQALRDMMDRKVIGKMVMERGA